jgi:hypothetical protein
MAVNIKDRLLPLFKPEETVFVGVDLHRLRWHVTVRTEDQEPAQRRRHCSRNQGHLICQGDKCLVIKENMSKHNYCMECAALIPRKAREEVN